MPINLGLTKTLVGSNNGDYLYTYAGDDYVYGEGGNDTIITNSGNDHIVATSTGLLGHWGNDVVWGGAGIDTIDYTLSVDRVVAFGGDDGDYIFGGSGNDALYGENGIDFINGGAGADYIDGGAGGDWLIGGANNDWFALNAGSSPNWDPDYIQDFSHLAGDRIDGPVAGTQYNTNVRIGGANTLAEIHDLARYEVGLHGWTYFICVGANEVTGDWGPGGTGETVYLFADLNGDRQIDSEIVLPGAVSRGGFTYRDII